MVLPLLGTHHFDVSLILLIPHGTDKAPCAHADSVCPLIYHYHINKPVRTSTLHAWWPCSFCSNCSCYWHCLHSHWANKEVFTESSLLVPTINSIAGASSVLDTGHIYSVGGDSFKKTLPPVTGGMGVSAHFHQHEFRQGLDFMLTRQNGISGFRKLPWISPIIF